ncbi:MAG: alpha/beta hydrolase-fold protein [Nonlabens sp.]
MKCILVLFSGLQLFAIPLLHAQDVLVEIGQKDSVYSKVLSEQRSLIISLPDDYHASGKSYPVLYLLDGSEPNLIDARLITYSLKIDMVIVAIANTDRNRDMMPLSRPSYEVDNPQAENFLMFLENELIPYIKANYRTNGKRSIRGRSLSGLFVIYAFLEKPGLFDNYIGTCAGWFSDMDGFFSELIGRAFEDQSKFNGKSLFVANSLSDPLDLNQEIHKSVLKFSKTLNLHLGDQVKFKYKTYENAGHVPYAVFYDGMKFIPKN